MRVTPTLLIFLCITGMISIFICYERKEQYVIAISNHNNITITSSHKKATKGRINEHIAFYYNPNDDRIGKRLKALSRVLDAAETYTEYYDIDDTVHTNILDNNWTFDITMINYTCYVRRCPNITVVKHGIKGSNPHFLTWKHREYMLRQNASYYDIFLYVEDDQQFTLQNLQYFEEYSPLAKAMGCRLGFLRLQDHLYTGGNNIFSPKRKWGQVIRYRPVNGGNNTSNSNKTTDFHQQQWALLDGEASYWAGWIMDRSDFISFSTSPEFLPQYNTINQYKIREIAAWGSGWCVSLGRPSNITVVVPLLVNGEKQNLHPSAKSFHMSEKYVLEECAEGRVLDCGVLYDTFDLNEIV